MYLYLVILALNRLFRSDTYIPCSNVNAIWEERRVRTEGERRKKQCRVIYSHIDIDSPDLTLTAKKNQAHQKFAAKQADDKLNCY